MSDTDWVSMRIERHPGGVAQARSPSLIRTTSFRLAACGAILASLGAGLVFVIIYYGTAGAMVRTLDRQIRNEVGEIEDPGKTFRTAGALESVREAESEVVRGTFITLIDPQGHVVATNLADFSRVQGWSWHNLIVTHPTSRIVTTRNLGIRLADGGLLVVGEDATALVQLRQRLAKTFFVGFGILVIFGLGAGIALGRNAVSRIQDINTTLESIMGGDFSRRLTRSIYRNELDDLAVSVNLMLDRIELLMENLRQVGNEIAHDLRSPLARLREGLELAQLADEETMSRNVIPWAISQTDSILEIFSALLRLSEIESGTRRKAFTLIDLSHLLIALVDTFAPAVEEVGGKLNFNIQPELSLSGDVVLLNQLFGNLILNAIKHTPPGTIIHIYAACAAQNVAIDIFDNGTGIPSHLHSMALRRFGRIDMARTVSGAGLGLPIAAAIAELHGGTLTLKDAKPGLWVEITLPWNRNAPPLQVLNT